MKKILLASILTFAVIGSGCYHHDDDYSYQTENCTSVDLGGGEEYELCCRLACQGEYDYDDSHESCREEYSCESSTHDPCPRVVIDQYGYPPCIY